MFLSLFHAVLFGSFSSIEKRYVELEIELNKLRPDHQDLVDGNDALVKVVILWTIIDFQTRKLLIEF